MLTMSPVAGAPLSKEVASVSPGQNGWRRPRDMLRYLRWRMWWRMGSSEFKTVTDVVPLNPIMIPYPESSMYNKFVSISRGLEVAYPIAVVNSSYNLL